MKPILDLVDRKYLLDSTVGDLQNRALRGLQLLFMHFLIDHLASISN
jgi:hypothetical protein